MAISPRYYHWLDGFPATSLPDPLAGKMFSLPMSHVNRRKALITKRLSRRVLRFAKIFPVFPARQGKRAAPLEGGPLWIPGSSQAVVKPGHGD